MILIQGMNSFSPTTHTYYTYDMKLTKLPLVAALSLLVLSSNAWAQSTKRLIDEVNPFIGTSNFGTTNPGAVVPNGLMSITPFNVSGSPELNKFDKDKRWWSTPYTADNKFFSGFSHVNLSGVGCLSWGVSSYRLLLAISM